jgi:hypothetical protein
LHELNAILPDAEIEPGDLFEMFDHERGIFFLDRHARPHGAAADSQVP